MKKLTIFFTGLLAFIPLFAQDTESKAGKIGYSLGRVFAIVLIILLVIGGDRIFRKKK